jgi:hypothetical protein
MNASLIRTIREIAGIGLSTARKPLGEDLPLCDRFRERRPGAFSAEKSSSEVQTDVCKSASKLTASCSKLPREEDEKKRKRDMPIVSRFTTQTVYHGHASSQLPTEKARLRHQRTGRHDVHGNFSSVKHRFSGSNGSKCSNRFAMFIRLSLSVDNISRAPSRCFTEFSPEIAGGFSMTGYRMSF